MNAIQKLNIGLALLILVLLALNLKTEDPEYLPLTNINPDTIASISLTSPQGTLGFSKNNETWILAESPNSKIQQEIISKLLGITRTHSYRQFENTAANRESFDLENPRFKIKLNNVTILFGTTEPVQQLRYILINNHIHLITDLYLQYLLANEDFFTHQE